MTAAQIDTSQRIEPAIHGRVLIVDDSRAQRHLLGMTLRRAGYDVAEASCAQEALDICADTDINLVISDWSMPGMDGPDLCRALRKMDRPYCYFILVTSQSDHSERALGLDAGADDFVTRPVSWVELRARIRAGARLLATQAALRTQNQILGQTLAELQELQAGIDRDLVEARKLQQSLMPAPLLAFKGGSVASKLITCGQVGGDLVGCFPLGAHKIGIYSLDVSGHGIASALMTGRLSGLFSTREPHRSIAYSSDSNGLMHLNTPDRVMDRINKLILSELDTDIYFTATLAYFDQQTGEIDMCQAGHPFPIVQRKDGATDILGDGGPPVGLLSGVEYQRFQTKLNIGDRLFLCSDGMTEALLPDGDMLGEEGIGSILEEHRDTRLDRVLSAIESTLGKRLGHRQFEDDVSMIILERPRE